MDQTLDVIDVLGRCASRSQRHRWLLLSLLAACVGLPACSAPPPPKPPPGEGPQTWWEEPFNSMPVWESPSDASPEDVKLVLSVAGEVGNEHLRARHDARPNQQVTAPAVHYGKAFREEVVPLDRACFLSWKWRARQHPAALEDAWKDLAASVYVIVRMPGLFGGGRGFKFGWLAKAGAKGEKQRGLFQIAQRVEPASDEWKEERVDLCSLYRSYYEGSPSEERVLYVGVVTDADNSESLAEADYDDVKLSSE